MTEQQPETVADLTRALTIHQQAASIGNEVMCRCDRQWRPNGVHAEHQARAALAWVEERYVPRQDVLNLADELRDRGRWATEDTTAVGYGVSASKVRALAGGAS